jgi:hypothetical protein
MDFILPTGTIATIYSDPMSELTLMLSRKISLRVWTRPIIEELLGRKVAAQV